MCKIMKFGYTQQDICKISRRFNDPNITAKTIKILEENGEHSSRIDLDNRFLDTTLKALSINNNNEKLDYIKVTNFSASKEIIKKMSKQSI